MAGPKNPSVSVADTRKLTDISWLVCVAGSSGALETIIIAVRLQGWKNNIETKTTLKKSHGSLGWAGNPFHQCITSMRRSVTWQANWQMTKTLPFCRNLYFALSLTEIMKSRALKKTAEKSRRAEIITRSNQVIIRKLCLFPPAWMWFCRRRVFPWVSLDIFY